MEEFYLILAGIIFISFMLCLTVLWLLSVCGILTTVEVGAGAPPLGEAVIAYKFARGPYKKAGELFCDVTVIAPDHKCIGIYYDDPNVVSRGASRLGEVVIAYKFAMGPYKKAGELFCDVITIIAPDHKCIGIYYDDPNVIPKEKLRFIVGAVLSEGKVKVEQDILDKMESEGLKIARLPAVEHSVKTSFPYASPLSIPIAVWKVYPALTRYIKENCLCAYPFLEIYEKDVINFMAPLSKQEDFFVPESRECIPEEYKREEIGDSFNESTRGSPSVYSDMSDDSRLSRSISRFSSASRNVYDNYSDDENDLNDSLNSEESVQDDEISSSIEVRASKASTNLLEESGSEPVTDTSVSNSGTQNTSKSDEGTDQSLHDSGICSGRTSIAPTDLSTEKKELSDGDRNDSSSSFEEILMDESMTLPSVDDPKSAES